MEQTWRWFGPSDKVTLSDARQAGTEGIVTALHDVPVGDVWTVDAIQKRQQLVEAAGLRWSVVESLDVSERIKLREPGAKDDIAHYIESLRNLARCGIRVVSYHWMPVLTWLRTHLDSPLANGGFTTRYDATLFAAFDLYMLRRKGAEEDWPEERRIAAHKLFNSLSSIEREHFQSVILQGLPGTGGSFTLQGLRDGIDRYRDMDVEAMRANASEFLRAVCPVADDLGIRMAVHPDDPPKTVLGLPRIVSTEEDLAFWLGQWPGESNGITFCTGALGVRADNDVVRMATRFGPRIWFAHLRSTKRESDAESFFEAAHLEGDVDLVAVMKELVKEYRRRNASGDMRSLPFRADHGQQLLNDIDRHAQAGYPAIGRLRGLAELRGILRAVEHS